MASTWVRRLTSGLTLGWMILTVFYFLGLSLAVFRVPAFPLAIGLARTTGRTGLWITLLPAAIGGAGLLLFVARKAAFGAGLLAVYSAFWFLMMLSGLPAVWNAKGSFCINSLNFCIVTPWIGRSAVVLLSAPFFLSTIWACRKASQSLQTSSAA
jgi:hypothetical protein